jgi:hypothetical protein
MGHLRIELPLELRMWLPLERRIELPLERRIELLLECGSLVTLKVRLFRVLTAYLGAE